MKKTFLFAALFMWSISATTSASGEGLTRITGEKSPFREGASSFEKAEFFAEEGVPAVLSESDVVFYKKAFKLQRQLKRDKVVAVLPKIKDKNILMGYLVAERLLHPRTKANYADLKYWLSRFHDQAPAKTIYKLANSRKPRHAKHRRPSVQKTSLARYQGEKTEATASVKKTRSKSRGRLLWQLRKYRVKQQYSKSMELLNKPSTRKKLGDETWHEVSTTLARHMMYKGEYALAESVARRVASGSAQHQLAALWIAGFSAYRLGDKEEAGKLFRRLAYRVPTNSSYYSRAAWWTAKVYEETGKESMARLFVNMAAQNPLSFYGQMAYERLDRTWPETAWQEPEINQDHQEDLFKDPAIRRVIALVQIGEHTLAQQEMKTVYDRIPYEWDESLLALSLRLDLPATSVTLARNLMERDKLYLSGLYPVSAAWKPRGGQKVDKALMHAVIRQESAFNPKVISRAGARGLMQVMPATGKFIQRKYRRPVYSRYSMTKPDINMMLGQTYLMYLEEQFEGNLLHMIAAYNAGPGNVRKWVGKIPSMNDDPVLFVESIPFNETRKYAMRVLSNLWMYRKRMQQDTPVLSAMAKNRWPVRVVSLKILDHDG